MLNLDLPKQLCAVSSLLGNTTDLAAIACAIRNVAEDIYATSLTKKSLADAYFNTKTLNILIDKLQKSTSSTKITSGIVLKKIKEELSKHE